MRLGDWRAVDERCDLLADTASRPAGGGRWTGKKVRALLYQAQIIRYDTDSGLWYCSIVAPKQDYPDGWESEAKLERKKRLAEREALGLTSTPRQKAKKKRKPKLDWAQLKWGRKATRPPLPGKYIF